MPENLPKNYEDNPNVSKDVPRIFGPPSRISFAKHNLFLYSKIGEYSAENCHSRALFNLLLVLVQITRLHIAYFPDVRQQLSDIWLQQPFSSEV